MEVTPDFWIMPISRGLINKGFPARWRYQTNRILSLRCLPFHHSGVVTVILASFSRSVKGGLLPHGAGNFLHFFVKTATFVLAFCVSIC